jgi:hypothetical protein
LIPLVVAAPHATNWTAIGVISAISFFIVGGFFAYLNSRLSGQDRKIETLEAVTGDTRVSVGRIEGYLASTNGNEGKGATPTQLPDLVAPVVVKQPVGVIVEKDPNRKEEP